MSGHKLGHFTNLKEHLVYSLETTLLLQQLETLSECLSCQYLGLVKLGVMVGQEQVESNRMHIL